MFFHKKHTLKLLVVGPTIRMKTVTSALENTGVCVILDGQVKDPYLIDTGREITFVKRKEVEMTDEKT